MRKWQWILVLGLNLSIALAFFIKNQGEGYSVLSSDQDNIIPMCMKMDDPSLYPNDLFAGDIENFKYYTPFFVQPLRFIAKFTDYDYIAALNVELFLTHLIFGIGWFLLFYAVVGKRFWVALLMSILIRGLVWLPGSEIWGISDIWTFLPRTVYAALLPIPFLFLQRKSARGLYIAAFLIGFIFNFHPISGLGGILIFSLLMIGITLFTERKYSLSNYIGAACLLILAAFPFIYTYFTKTPSDINYDVAIYEQAFGARIPSAFQDPMALLSQWWHPKIFFYVIPLVLYSLYSFLIHKKERSVAWILLLLTAGLFVLPILSIPVENWFNEVFDKNLRMSFQIVRVQKLSVLPAYIAMALLLKGLIVRIPIFQQIIPYLLMVYILIIGVSHAPIFDRIPFISEDITRGIFPRASTIFATKESKINDFDRMANYIQKQTPKEAVFYQNFRLRAASKRSVRFDRKGASILIESSPSQLIQWFEDKQMLRQMTLLEKMEYLRSNGVQYWLTYDEVLPTATQVNQIGRYSLYKL